MKMTVLKSWTIDNPEEALGLPHRRIVLLENSMGRREESWQQSLDGESWVQTQSFVLSGGGPEPADSAK